MKERLVVCIDMDDEMKKGVEELCVKKTSGGFRMGNVGIPVADSFRYFAKLIQYCKV